ncbi:MAG TPA: GNAT family N-acetyltransferase [Thiobacillaceae bacterium]|nr:GNAT family N-acetyltransferase [Thiobacillaceae bacterium]
MPAAEWDALVVSASPNPADPNPGLAHAFLLALEESRCACPASGWEPRFLTRREAGRLVGALPLYAKHHSWGEFVFDWAWAEAYRRQGMAYYPKWIVASPFTPTTGPRLLAATPAIRAELLDHCLELAKEAGVSSLHLLFPHEAQAREMADRGMLLRRGVQFHWRNPGYGSFEDYLADLRRDKRKKVRQERRQVFEAGIRFRHLSGGDIGEAEWRHFMACYGRTHQTYQSPPALNLDFFLRIGATMPDRLLLVMAYRDGRPIAAAFNLRGPRTLYGRAWGALEFHPGLHFETCYYQAIEHCIEHRIDLFEGGAQGEHKLARGFLPSTTWSAHWLAEPRFAKAVEDFLDREGNGLDDYMDTLSGRSPFRQAGGSEPGTEE